VCLCDTRLEGWFCRWEGLWEIPVEGRGGGDMLV
jgi:hypothetical protein